MGDVLDGPS